MIARRVGYWSGLAAFGATLAYVVVQVLQMLGLLRKPLDEILIYGASLAIVFPFVLEMVALHHVAPNETKVWSHAAVIFTTIYAVFASANYIVQLGTVIPMSLAGEAAEIHVLQQTPHSLFWNFDALAYIFMAVAMLMAIPVFDKMAARRVRVALAANVAVTPLIAIVYYYPRFSPELVLIALPWAITAPVAMLLVALWLGKRDEPTHSDALGANPIPRWPPSPAPQGE